MSTYDIARLKAALGPIKTEDNAAIVKQKSRDFFWYSPVLKRQLDHVTGDLVVSPKDEAEVLQVLKTCFEHGVPVTPRGAGTGNYGQAMPLSGGVVLNLAEMNKVKSISRGSVVAEAGAVMAEVDRQTRAAGQQELRLHPSTYNTASIAGFVAGGSGGVGSINWGGLRNVGNVISMRVATMEAKPRIMEMRGRDLMKVMHAYGTNGVITEVEMPLDAAYDWIDVVVGFDDYMKAVVFANDIANEDGLLFKEVATVAAPAPHDFFLRHQKFLRREQSVVLLMVAPHAMAPFLSLAEHRRGEIVYRSDTATAEEKKGLPPVYEMTWNHTTLRALRVDPTITYLQVLYPFPHSVERVATMTKLLGDEVPGHLEFIRFDGNVAATGLPMVRFTSEERLDEIIRIHEANGCLIFNPHRYTLEEGGMKQTDAVQLAFKHEADPKGLLNPGKMIAWENPDFDLKSDKVYLFPGMQAAE
jgi:FAD/FMN-containing dehydrogenase